MLYCRNVLFDGNDLLNTALPNVMGPSVAHLLWLQESDRVQQPDDDEGPPPNFPSGRMGPGNVLSYEMKNVPNAYFSFSPVFNSNEYKGRLNIIGADITVVGGTGDFFVARGIMMVETEAVMGTRYFRPKNPMFHSQDQSRHVLNYLHGLFLNFIQIYTEHT